MKKTILSAALFMVSVATSFAQTWSLDKSHAGLSFTITHMMISDVDGKFKSFDAKVTSSKADFSDAVFELTAEASSINTDNDMRDGHLKGADFFDVEKFPKVAYKSTSFKKVADKKYVLLGNLTMHGVTKPVTLNVTLNGPVENPRSKKQMIGLKAIGTVKRSDFGISTMPEAALSNEIEIRANGEFVKD